MADLSQKTIRAAEELAEEIWVRNYISLISGSSIQNGDKIGCGNSALCEAKMSTIDYLKSEVERLSNELQQACLEKVQAAEYGLAVLEEKQRLQEQYDELETSLEANKQELECLREVNI